MGVIIAILGVAQMIAGVLFYVAAASAIHEILGSVSFGLGAVCLALASVIGHLARAEADAAALRKRMDAIGSYLDDFAQRLKRRDEA